MLERDGLYYEKFTEKPFTGKVTGIKQGKIQKGKIEGKWIEYYNNGQLKEKRNYKDGKLIKTLTHKWLLKIKYI